MPFVLAVIGIILVVAAARGTGNIRKLGKLLVSDFTGQNNFLVWVFAIGLIGVVGYIPAFKGLSRAFLVLLFVVLLLATRGGFLAQIQNAFKSAGSGSGSGTGDPINNAVTGTFNGLTGNNPAQNAPSTGTVQ